MLCQKKGFVHLIIICTSLLTFSIGLSETAVVSWDANTENDLSGYKIYYGKTSVNYDNVIDVGNATSFTVTQLDAGETYFFAVTAYDVSGNESGFSEEVSLAISAPNTNPPVVSGVTVPGNTQIDILFSKALDKTSAENSANYSISNGVQVLGATLDSDLTTVHLVTSDHQPGGDYTITITSLVDTEGNQIAANTTQNYNVPANPNNDTTAPELVSVNVKGATQIDINFSEPIDKASAEDVSNYSISPAIQVVGAILDANLTRVHLVTGEHRDDVTYTLTVSSIFDRAETPNEITSNTTFSYTGDPGGSTPPPAAGLTPDTFTLNSNFPNPFNPETLISFFLDKRREVELNIYNPLGQLVKTLVSEEMSQGNHAIKWDGTNNDNLPVPSGVYIYSLEVKRDVQKGNLLVDVSLERRVKRMTLLR